MTTEKTIALTKRTFVGKVMSLLLNMLSRLVITFLLRSKRLLISWLQSPSAVSLEPPKINSDTVSTVYPSICHEMMGPDAMIFIFWMLSFKPTFSLSSFTFITQGDGDGQGGLACYNSWGRKVSDTTERLNWTSIFPFPPPSTQLPLFYSLLLWVWFFRFHILVRSYILVFLHLFHWA